MGKTYAYVAWEKIFNEHHLEQLFLHKTRGNSSVGLDWITSSVFEASLSKEVSIILRKSKANAYRFTRYRELLISKGALKPPRCISIPTMRDKLVLSALNELIFGVYGSISTTPMPHSIISEIRDMIEAKKYDSFIKLDISTFYASIDHDILLKQLRKRIRKPEILNLISSAIMTPTVRANAIVDSEPRTKGIPEGLSISNALANIYLQLIDTKYSRDKRINYWRYVDDIIILCKHQDIGQIEESISCDISNLRLSINHEKTKTGPIESGFEYLGYYIKPGSISIRQASVIALERAIEDIFRSHGKAVNPNPEYLYWKINLKITGFVIDNKKYGWLFFYSQITELTCLSHLDWFIRSLSDRFGIDNHGFKSFMRSYHEITKALHSTRYIPNLDKLSIEEKKHIVQDIYGEGKKDDDEKTIESKFRHLMKKEIRNVQKDIQPFS